MASSKNSILFVCLGNICRSPMAEAVFLDLIRSRGIEDEWVVDSCGTIDYHAGKNPDSRARMVLQEKGVEYTHKARIIRKDDFTKFNWIIGMDDSNLYDLNAMKPSNSSAKIHKLGEFDNTPTVRDVRDPYYDRGDKGFYDCFDQCKSACGAFLDKLREGKK